MGKSQDLYRKAKRIIPGGTQLLSKRPEMYLPENWPTYFTKAKGCEVWDIEGRKFYDMGNMSVGAGILGYADDDVDTSVIKAINEGIISTLNAPEEVELAELLLEIHPWAGMVRYARGGGEGMAVAVRIARAKTKKPVILFCGYHGWHDWYLSANLSEDRALDGHLLPGLDPAGVPRHLTGSAFPFEYNDTRKFLSLVRSHEAEIGAVVMEAVRNDYPTKEFLETVRSETLKHGIPLVVDEVSSGWRLNLGGAHLSIGLEPDIAVFAKGMSNGYPMAAIIGKPSVMEAAQDSFISSTFWTDKVGPVAALATIKKLRKHAVAERLCEAGKRVQEGWKSAAESAGIPVHVGGIYPLSHFAFEHEQPLVLKTLFTQEMLKKDFLATTGYYPSFAHTDSHIESYLSAAEETFALIKKAVDSGEPRRFLEGPVCHSGFKRLA